MMTSPIATTAFHALNSERSRIAIHNATMTLIEKIGTSTKWYQGCHRVCVAYVCCSMSENIPRRRVKLLQRRTQRRTGLHAEVMTDFQAQLPFLRHIDQRHAHRHFAD